MSTAATEKKRYVKMQLLRVACVLSAVQAFVGTRANHVASPSRHRRDMNYGTQVAPRAARQPIALRGAPEDAADAKIDSYVKDNKVRVGVRGDARPPRSRHRRDRRRSCSS